ncbi:MAG: hypothetical protein ACTSPQ_16205 [Candidatus Helarchaeota archaeon]
MYKEFKEAKIHGFSDKQEYIFSKNNGIKNKKEYDIFRNSGYRKYSDYQDGLKNDFPDSHSFYDAKNLGIKHYSKYKDFIKKNFKELLNKVKKIEFDAKKMYDNGHFEQFIQLKYLAVEKLAEILYLELFDEDVLINNNLRLSTIIERIEKKLKKSFNIIDELNSWRKRRNQIVHEYIKITREEANSASQFFNELAERLYEEFNKSISN